LSDAASNSQGDDELDGNVAFDDGDGGADEDGSDQPEDEEADDDEEGDDNDEPEDSDELRQSFKEKARSISRQGDLRRGKRRLRRLGLLNDGGSVSSSAEEEEEEEEDGEEGEEGEEGEDEEADGEAEEDLPDAGEADDHPAAVAAAGKRVPAADGGDLPFVFDAPTTHAEFARWVDGRPPEELSLVITRICACHAIALAAENRRKMQTFFGVLVVHFERLTQQSPMPSALLDAMVPHLLALSREVPYYAATVARARLSKMQAGVAESQQRGVFEWPPARTLSLLRLFTLMFPASDFRHAVLTPAALLLGQYLAHCEVRSVRDAAVGVLAATLAQELASASKRFVPEVLAFTSSLVHTNSRGSTGLPVHLASQMGDPCLAVDLPKGSKAAMHTLRIAEVLQAPAGDALFDREDIKLGVLHAALSVLAKAADQAASLPSALVMLAPAHAAVERLRSKAKRLPPVTAALVTAIVTAHERASSAVHAPLQLHARKAEPIKTFNPRFEEEGYVKGRDYDVDRERAEARKLKKQLHREAKGAARELRKDNRFLADERAKMVASAGAEREAKHRAALSFLEQQEADFKSGGQGGMMKRKKK
jgi:nucleolar protein 14